MTATDQIVPGRSCGTCMMCCKLPSVPAMNKPQGKWCVQASPGRGCKIYDDRPEDCRNFHCGWLVDPTLGPEWKPEICKFLIFVAGDGSLTIMVDPGAPAAWKDPRYYPVIKTTAARLIERNMPTMIIIGSKRIVVLPDRDVDVSIPEGHGARVVTQQGQNGLVYSVVVEALPAAAA